MSDKETTYTVYLALKDLPHLNKLEGMKFFAEKGIDLSLSKEDAKVILPECNHTVAKFSCC